MGKKNDLVEVLPDHWISNRGIKSIKYYNQHEIMVSYMSGDVEVFQVRDIPMTSLLAKLGRLPGTPKGSADSP